MTLAYFEVLCEVGRVSVAAREFVLERTPKERFALCLECSADFYETVRELGDLGLTLGDFERIAKGQPEREVWGRPSPEGAALSKTPQLGQESGRDARPRAVRR